MSNPTYLDILKAMTPKECTTLAIELDKAVPTVIKWRAGKTKPGKMDQEYIAKRHAKAQKGAK